MVINEVIQYQNKNWTIVEIEDTCVHLIDNTGYGICVLKTEL